MHEYSTEAIVLDREEAGESDAYVTFYAKELGRIRARATSLRKVTSKLSAHLRPGDLSHIRLVSKYGDGKMYRIADALRIRRLSTSSDFLSFIKDLTVESENEAPLWDMLTKEKEDKSRVLRVLGWDPEHAPCSYCSQKPVYYFSGTNQMFSCYGCGFRFPQNEVLYEI